MQLRQLAPTTKDDAGVLGFGAAIGIILVWLVGFGVDVPAEPAVAIGVITTFFAGRWFS